jgi:UDP-glucose 4-epimerase
MKNIIVTGGSGFIGSNIVDLLIKKNFNVTILDKKKPENLKTNFIKSDLSNIKTLKKITKNIDCIYHLAGVSDVTKVKKMPILTIKDNILLTANLIEAARMNRIKRFIFASSIYVNSKSGNLYTTSKIAAENIIKNYFLLYKTKYTILRFATAYGTNNRGADVISLFMKRALKNKTINVHGNGNQTRDFIHAEDLASCSLKILKKKYENKTLTIGNMKKVKIIDLAKLIKKSTRTKCKIKINKKQKRFDDFDLNKIKKISFKDYLKYKKKFSLKKGIEKLYRENI